MKVLVTGSSGLVGSELVIFFDREAEQVVGIDNNMRADFFGQEGDTQWNLQRLLRSSGELRLAHLGAPDEQWGDLLARTLSLDSTQRVRLSGAAAEAWREALGPSTPANGSR